MLDQQRKFEEGGSVRPAPTLEDEVKWLREGLEEALKHLQADPPRKTLARNVIKGTLAGPGGCW